MLEHQTKLDLKKGDPMAYREIFRLLYPRLKAYCTLFIKDPDEAEDIIQEVFITLWEKRNAIKVHKSVESWIFVMLRNRCLNRLKKARLDDDNFEIENLTIRDLQYLYQLDFLNREEKSLEEKLSESLKQAIDSLPARMRKVLVACKMEGRKQKEVAGEMGISVKMVEKQIARAKKILRKKLIKEYSMIISRMAIF